MKKQIGATVVEFLIFALFFLAVGGWVANLVKLIGMIGGEVTTMFVMRVVGIFAAPLGTVLGFM